MFTALSFFTVFQYTIFGSFMVSNIIYYYLLGLNIFRTRTLKIRKGTIQNVFFLLFISWATLSTAIFSLQNQIFSIRNLIQYILFLHCNILFL